MKIELKQSDFPSDTIASKLDLDGIEKYSPLHKLIRDINISRSYDINTDSDSIMSYGMLCKCDSGYLCEHRLQNIVDFIKNNFKK